MLNICLCQKPHENWGFLKIYFLYSHFSGQVQSTPNSISCGKFAPRIELDPESGNSIKNVVKKHDNKRVKRLWWVGEEASFVVEKLFVVAL